MAILHFYVCSWKSTVRISCIMILSSTGLEWGHLMQMGRVWNNTILLCLMKLLLKAGILFMPCSDTLMPSVNSDSGPRTLFSGSHGSADVVGSTHSTCRSCGSQHAAGRLWLPFLVGKWWRVICEHLYFLRQYLPLRYVHQLLVTSDKCSTRLILTLTSLCLKG